ncbi:MULTISPECIES: SDR family oxidoreductase [Carnobacterium]|uniref:3-oxoacyl-ACP reductase n=2 Tax=Carnobacterium inhibens TaxID=147709 RepID=U5S7H2_9LACT|nr:MULTISPECIES: SDR family oxidoreductase [Carnobacterium]AGY81164.1 3-oxoacyl-ACP reductase [Carnobacterium inhibens subsp. gilichinskyi]MBC9826113.1 SDR family oxidoreductase [Carnobacterium inhibens]MDN5372881.1 3-oxoacyl-[acyl-carrier protein] reductase [Carnobacterium sp.]
MELNLANKTALVLASSQGLGKAIATELVKEGTNVMISSRNPDKLKRVQDELNGLKKGKVVFFPADLTKSEDINQLVKETRKTFGSIDILINNAGGPPSGTFEEFSDEEWEHSFQLNLMSYIRTIREVLPDLKKTGGKIINIASSSIKQPISGLILSNTFRMGIVGLSKTLAEELGPYNILINTVAPGKIATDRITTLDEMTAKKQQVSVEEIAKTNQKAIPLGRYGTPEEFAKFVVFLVSDVNTYVTGSAIIIDGGSVKAI